MARPLDNSSWWSANIWRLILRKSSTGTESETLPDRLKNTSLDDNYVVCTAAVLENYDQPLEFSPRIQLNSLNENG